MHALRDKAGANSAHREDRIEAVIASAIEDAEGFPIRSMPISPAELWELRQQHTKTTDPVPAQEGSR